MGRIRYIDELRAVATFAVVGIHVASNNWYGFVGTPDWVTFTVYAGICKFCVPVFFMISGVLFLNQKREISIKRLYAHNIGKLVAFLLSWSIVYMLFHLIESGSQLTPALLFDYVKDIAKGDTQVHFWFIYAIIGIYVIAPIIKVFTDNAGRNLVEYFLVLWLLVQSVFDAFSQVPIVGPIFNNIDKMNIQVTMSYLGFFVLGHYLGKYELTSIAKRWVYGLGFFGLLASIGITLYVSMQTGVPNESCFGYFFPGVVLYGSAVFLFFKSKGNKDVAACINGRESFGARIVDIASRESLGVYGVHMLFVFALWNAGLSTFRFPAFYLFPSSLSSYLFCRLALVGLYRRFPLSIDSWFSGS